MKLKHLLLAGVAAGAANMAMAAAPDQITFSGEVVESTCAVTVVGAMAGEVKLPTVNTSKLAAANDTAGDTPFSLKVAAYSVTDTLATKIKPSFFATEVDGTDLANTGGSATKVAIRLFEDSVESRGYTGNTALNFSTGYATTSTFQDIPTAGDLEFPFVAKYVATGTATPGTVVAIVNYELIYD